jgi:hypothetical protein
MRVLAGGVRAVTVGGAVLALLAVASPAGAEPAPGVRSNLGLCSPYLAGLPAPTSPSTGDTLGGNARSGVNLLIRQLGDRLPEATTRPGELYRVRARQHPDTPAEVECAPRPQAGGPA